MVFNASAGDLAGGIEASSSCPAAARVDQRPGQSAQTRAARQVGRVIPTFLRVTGGGRADSRQRRVRTRNGSQRVSYGMGDAGRKGGIALTRLRAPGPA